MTKGSGRFGKSLDWKKERWNEHLLRMGVFAYRSIHTPEEGKEWERKGQWMWLRFCFEF